MGKHLKLTDLREAEYNPRIISAKRLENLQKSMLRFGDLSGVVFNESTKKLVSGHQRLKTIREAGLETEIVTSKRKDKHGTVAEGYIIAKTPDGEIRLPLRVVNWADKKAEIAANIAANAHGGDFDRTKLGALLVKLEKGKAFDIDTLGLDPLSLRGLMQVMPTLGTKGEGGGEEDGESFPEYGEDSFDLHHTCPKCKFRFSASASSKKAPGPKENKQVEAAKKTKAAKKDAEKKASKKSKSDDDAPVKKKKSKNKDEPAKKSKKDKFKKLRK